MKKSIIKTLLIALLLNTGVVFSQTEDKPWNVGAFLGRSEYYGDLGNGFFNFNKAYYGFGSLTFSRYLNKMFDVSLLASYGEHGYYVPKKPSTSFRTRNAYADLTARYKIIQKADAKFVPSVFLGLGIRNLDGAIGTGTYRLKSGMDIVIPVGFALDYKLTSSLSLRYIASFGYTLSDERDRVKGGMNDMQLLHSIGVTFSFGKKDSDKDGVSDDKDKCPDTPLGTPVDADGCMLDKDKDGIADNVDDCPDVAGIQSFKGCPDTDGDGIKDSEDACPTVKGIANFKGCPDTDGDGIEDAKDKCPDVAGIAQFEGCPDTDGDGIKDSEDACPNVKGTAAMQGCPDTDGDGVADNKDKCPTVPGLAQLNGCPEVKINAKAKEIFQKAMSGIQFEIGKDIIKKTSYPILDNVVNVLKENPDWKVEVQGHTDNVGNAEANKTLSDKRATAVENYLIAKGIAANRLTSNGYGAERPIADNKTAAGRAQNRRVEFKVTYEQ